MRQSFIIVSVTRSPAPRWRPMPGQAPKICAPGASPAVGFLPVPPNAPSSPRLNVTGQESPSFSHGVTDCALGGTGSEHERGQAVRRDGYCDGRARARRRRRGHIG